MMRYSILPVDNNRDVTLWFTDFSGTDEVLGVINFIEDWMHTANIRSGYTVAFSHGTVPTFDALHRTAMRSVPVELEVASCCKGPQRLNWTNPLCIEFETSSLPAGLEMALDEYMDGKGQKEV